MAKNTNDSLGLGKLGGFDLSAMLEPTEAKFQELETRAIREDGENPRHTFDPATLEELAETIRARGVITPISVRPNPEQEGEYIVNHGHRRLRAAKLAGLSTIPAVIDATFRDEDRIIENIQRDNLDMFDVAEFVGKKLGEGLKQKEVAKRIGKSTAYVSQHAQLLDLPPHTAQAVKAGRVTDLTSIADLAKLEKQHPGAVERFLAGDHEVTRTAVKNFRENLLENADPAGPGVYTSNHGEHSIEATWPLKNADKVKAYASTSDNKDRDSVVTHGGKGEGRGPANWGYGQVIVDLDGKRGMLLLQRRPRNENFVWVKWEDGEIATSEIAVARLTIKAVVGGWRR